MAFYGDVDKIIDIVGSEFTSDDITEGMKDVINSYIDSEINEDGFDVSIDADEYYDIKKDYQTELLLKHFPVISVSSITDDVHATTPTTVNSEAYTVDKDTGIIQLITAYKSLNGTESDFINAFTKGFNSVRVQYKYGFKEVPDIIVQLANLLTSKWLKIQSKQSDADGLKSVSIADYKETYDTSFVAINSEYDGMIKKMINKAKGLYAKGY